MSRSSQTTSPPTKRVTKQNKLIINEILDNGLNYYEYNFEEALESLQYNISHTITKEELNFCLEYIDDKFHFWSV